MLIFIQIRYYLPFDPHTHTYIYILRFNMAITDSTPNTNLSINPKTHGLLHSNLQTHATAKSPPQSCAKLSPQYQSKITQLCLHNLVGSPHPCTMPNLISAIAGPTYFLCKSNWRERERESIKCGGNFAIFDEHCSLFYILTSFKRRADEKNNVFKLIYIKR